MQNGVDLLDHLAAPRCVTVAALVALLPAACSGGEATGDLVEVRDSAGVRVVYSAGPQWEAAEGWTVAPSPSVVIGRAPDTLPIGEDDIRRVEAHLIERAGPEAVSYVRETFQTAVYADRWPVHTRRMVVDRVGNLWVHHFVRPWQDVERQEWSVFDPEGVVLGEVRTPAALRVTEIGTDYVLGVWRDSLDVESVRLFPLDKGGEGS